MWKRTPALAALVLALVGMVVLPAPVTAQSESDFDPSWSLAFGTGFVADPEGYLLAFELERRMGPHFALGALLQLGLEKDDTLVGTHGYARYVFQIEDSGEAGRIEPFLLAGLGFTHLDRDGTGRHRGSNTSFSMIFGGGLDYNFSDSLAIGSKMLVGVVPADVLGETAYFSWEIARIKVSF